MPTPPASRPEDDGHLLSPRERATFEDIARRFGEATGGPPAQGTRPHSPVDGLAWIRWPFQVMIVTMAVTLLPSLLWAAVAIIGIVVAVELLLVVRRRRRATGTTPIGDP